MNIKLKTWIGAARLRTLPLSIAGILVGTALAIEKGFFNWAIFLLALGTTLGLQILSNFANDYGDGVKGTDNDERVGPMRALQSGIITGKEMKKAMFITASITFIMALVLIYQAFGIENFGYSLFFLVAGIASIVAAIKYTVGDSAYGYKGLGDLFVFVFFGLLSVCGTFFLFTKNLELSIFLPAISVGLLSAAVLNLNNMRDRISDERAGKFTLVVKLGASNAKVYHVTLIMGALVSMLSYILFREDFILVISLLAFIPLLIHLQKVFQTKIPDQLDPELKKVALSTFLFSVLLLVSVLF